MTEQTFRASYEDAARTEAAARTKGYNGTDGSLMDYVEPDNYRTGRTFATLAEAEGWLKAEIVARKTVFGCGMIRMIEPVKRRCRYCMCGGSQVRHEYTVEETGVVQDELVESSCYD